MKAERRHELQENALAKDLGKAEVFVREHWKPILLGIILVVLAIVLVFWALGQRQQARDVELQNFHAYQAAPSSDPEARQGLRDLAQSTGQRDLAAWAWVQAGQMAYETLIEQYPQLSPEQREALAAEAQQAFSNTSMRYGEVAPAAASAHLGLGMLAETQLDLDAARQAYEQAAALGPRGASVQAAEARRRLERLPALSEPLVFPPAPREEQPDADEPDAPAAAPEPQPAPEGELQTAPAPEGEAPNP